MAMLGYARVSSSDQDTALQIEQLYAAGCKKVWAEKKSGKGIAERVELEACISAAKKGDIILCARLDRLARSIRDLWNIVERLEDKGVGLKCLHQEINTATPEGRLLFTLLGAVAEFEVDIRGARQKEGIERAKREGKTWGGSKPLGLKKALRLKRAGYAPLDIIQRTGIGRQHLRREELFGVWPWTKQDDWMLKAMELYGEGFFPMLKAQPFTIARRRPARLARITKMTPWLAEREAKRQERSAKQREAWLRKLEREAASPSAA